MVHWPGDPAVRISRLKSIAKGDSNNLSLISMGLHSGTHIDAPLHVISNAQGADKIPFQPVIGPARVLAIKDKQCIEEEELRPYRIKPGERIIFKTRNSSFGKKEQFRKDFVYIPAETAKYLVASGERTVGIDYFSVGGYHKDGAETHKIFLKAGVWIIEGLDLSRVKPGDYDLICLPLKIADSDGAPARVIIRQRR